MFTKIKRFARNLRLWYPVLKEDESWDSYYLYKVIEHKLKLMEDIFRGDNTHTANILTYADEIKECRVLLDRLMKDDYMSNEASEYYEKFDLKNLNKQMNDIQKKTILEWSKKEEEAKEKDKQELFCLLNKNIENWWD